MSAKTATARLLLTVPPLDADDKEEDDKDKDKDKG